MRRVPWPTLAALIAAACIALPGTARADDGLDLDHINVTYHGGPLLQHVRVSTLFWGRYWEKSHYTHYLNNLFPTLFADGRYLANLAQYSAGSYQIGNGRFIRMAIDASQPPAVVSDEEIQEEIRAQVKVGRLPEPEADGLYVVFTPPYVVLTEDGLDSLRNFSGYHGYYYDGQGGGFAYAVLPYSRSAEVVTMAASHELTEAVTDPQPELQRTGQGGWYDERNGEIADIPVALYETGRIGWAYLLDAISGPDDTFYVVQKVWSRKEQRPVALAPARSASG